MLLLRSRSGRLLIVTGLLDFQVGPGLAVTAHRAKGYDMGLVATLEKVEDVTSYGLHPAHQEYQTPCLALSFHLTIAGRTDSEKTYAMRLWHSISSSQGSQSCSSYTSHHLAHLYQSSHRVRYEATKSPSVCVVPTLPGKTIYGTSGHFGLPVGSLRHSGTPVAAWPTTLAFFMPSPSVAISLLVIPP